MTDDKQLQLRAKRKAYRDANKERINAHNRAYVSRNKEKEAARCKLYADKNKDKKAEYCKAWYSANKARITKRQMAYNKMRRESDPIFKLSEIVRVLVCTAMRRKGYSKKTKTYEIIGCSFAELNRHLIASARRNYGGKFFPKRPYHIDHIQPLATAKTEEEVLKLNHYSNLQYLYPRDNLRKSDKFTPE
jgi:hypothetical protein